MVGKEALLGKEEDGRGGVPHVSSKEEEGGPVDRQGARPMEAGGASAALSRKAEAGEARAVGGVRLGWSWASPGKKKSGRA
jgi:hypothetical protein